MIAANKGESHYVSGLQITPPLFEMGPKAYLYDKDVLDFAKHADAMSKKYDVQVIFTPQYVDISLLACEMKQVLVFAQHMDSLEVGGALQYRPKVMATS